MTIKRLIDRWSRNPYCKKASRNLRLLHCLFSTSYIEWSLTQQRNAAQRLSISIKMRCLTIYAQCTLVLRKQEWIFKVVLSGANATQLCTWCDPFRPQAFSPSEENRVRLDHGLYRHLLPWKHIHDYPITNGCLQHLIYSILLRSNCTVSISSSESTSLPRAASVGTCASIHFKSSSIEPLGGASICWAGGWFLPGPICKITTLLILRTVRKHFRFKTYVSFMLKYLTDV